MNLLRRQAWMGLLALLILTAPLLVLAQDNVVRLDGSRIVANVVEALATTYAEETGADVSLEISGTTSGLARLCNGEIDIATAARPILETEAQACADHNVQWVEVLLGYDAVALLTNPANDFATCLTLSELTTLLGPSATDSITNWSQIKSYWEQSAFELFAPPPDDTTINLLDELLPGDGLRSDMTSQDSASSVVSTIAENTAGLGFAPLSAVLASEAEVHIINLDDMSGTGCVAPEQSTLENGTYPAARGLYFYVSAASLEREAVAGLVDTLLSADGQAAVAANGFIAPSEQLAEQIRTNVADRVTGRAFSEAEPPFSIPLDVSGSITAEAAAAGYPALNNVADEFTSDYETATVTVTAFGNAAAYRRLCSGDVDMAVVTRAASDEETTLCQENVSSPWEIALGHQAVVIAVPAAAEFAACLTTDQLTTLWQDQGENTATNWNQVDDSFPDLPITIFLPLDGQSRTDVILTASSGQLLNPRRDALENKNDGLYRLAATANVEGAVTYVDFADYQASEANVIPVGIDAGAGCVEPTLDTIRDGSYLLAHPVTLLVSQRALARPEVQSLIWYLLRDASRTQMENADVILFDEAMFEGYREAAVEMYAAAEAAVAAEETSTPEATPEAQETPAATSEATTPAAEETSTPEFTPAAEETSAATSEATTPAAGATPTPTETGGQ